MKTTLTIFLMFLVTILYAQKQEEASIKNVLTAETTAYMNREYDAWAAQWDSKNEVSFLVTNAGFRSDSWEEISKSMKEDMENNSNPIKATLETSDFDFSVNGNQAFVIYVQNMKLDGQDYKSYEVRNLHKVKGKWKLAAMVSSKIEE